MKRKFGNSIIEAKEIVPIRISYNDNEYGRKYFVTVQIYRTFIDKITRQPISMHDDKEIEITKKEYTKIAKEFFDMHG